MPDKTGARVLAIARLHHAIQSLASPYSAANLWQQRDDNAV
jgi:hypothetical protein